MSNPYGYGYGFTANPYRYGTYQGYGYGGPYNPYGSGYGSGYGYATYQGYGYGGPDNPYGSGYGSGTDTQPTRATVMSGHTILTAVALAPGTDRTHQGYGYGGLYSPYGTGSGYGYGFYPPYGPGGVLTGFGGGLGGFGGGLGGGGVGMVGSGGGLGGLGGGLGGPGGGLGGFGGGLGGFGGGRGGPGGGLGGFGGGLGGLGGFGGGLGSSRLPDSVKKLALLLPQGVNLSDSVDYDVKNQRPITIGDKLAQWMLPRTARSTMDRQRDRNVTARRREGHSPMTCRTTQAAVANKLATKGTQSSDLPSLPKPGSAVKVPIETVAQTVTTSQTLAWFNISEVGVTNS